MANDLRLEPKRALTRRDIRRQKARFRGDLIICLGLYVSLVCIYLLIVRAVNHQALLTGEESTVSFADVVALTRRFQFSHWSTNFGGHLFYWVASEVEPFFGLFYGRRWKAAAMALLAPLVFLTLRRRLGSGRLGAAIGALAVGLVPGVTAFPGWRPRMVWRQWAAWLACCWRRRNDVDGGWLQCSPRFPFHSMAQDLRGHWLSV